MRESETKRERTSGDTQEPREEPVSRTSYLRRLVAVGVVHLVREAEGDRDEREHDDPAIGFAVSPVQEGVRGDGEGHEP